MHHLLADVACDVTSSVTLLLRYSNSPCLRPGLSLVEGEEPPYSSQVYPQKNRQTRASWFLGYKISSAPPCIYFIQVNDCPIANAPSRKREKKASLPILQHAGDVTQRQPYPSSDFVHSFFNVERTLVLHPYPALYSIQVDLRGRAYAARERTTARPQDRGLGTETNGPTGCGPRVGRHASSPYIRSLELGGRSLPVASSPGRVVAASSSVRTTHFAALDAPPSPFQLLYSRHAPGRGSPPTATHPAGRRARRHARPPGHRRAHPALRHTGRASLPPGPVRSGPVRSPPVRSN